MPDTAISALTAAAALDGTEVLPLVQATSTVRTTAQEIANLASATSAKINTVSNTLSNLISLHDVLSNRVSANSAVGGGGSVTSTMAETLSNAVSALEVRVSTLSATPPGTASVTSTDLSAAVGVSVIMTGAVSVKGLQSVVNVLSDRVSGAWDVGAAADTHASAASAAATSVDARVNTVSNLVSQHTVSLAQLSNAVSLVNTVSAKSAATSVKGLQSVVDQFSNRISAIVGGAGITSDQASAMIHSVLSTEYSARTSVGGATSVKGLQSVINALSAELVNEVSIRAVSVETASAAATSADGHANTVSAAAAATSATLVSVQSTVSHLASIVSLVSCVSAAGTAVGLQSVINALSARLTGGGLTSDQTSAMIASVLTTKYSARTSIAGATSVKGLQSALDSLSLQISSLNSVVSNALSAGDVISLKIVSMASTLSHLASTVSLVSCVSAAGTAVGLQSVVNALSASLVSLEVHASAASAAATSVNGRVTSVNATWTSGLGTNVAIGINTNGVVMTGNSFVTVSGLGVPLVANGDYQIDGRVFFTLSILTGTRFGFSYNTTGNGQMVKGAMDMRCSTSVIAAAISNLVSTNFSYGHINEAAMSNAATANISITGGASATTHMLLIDGMLQNGNSAVTLNLQAAHSAASGGINILAGSYIRAYRIV